MKYLLTCLLLLSGCANTVPVAHQFPDAPPELMKQCSVLAKVEGDKVTVSNMLKVVANNYALYYECAAKVEGWQEWHTKQNQIFNSVGK